MTDIKFIVKPDETGLGRIIVDGRFYGLPVAAVDRFARNAALVGDRVVRNSSNGEGGFASYAQVTGAAPTNGELGDGL